MQKKYVLTGVAVVAAAVLGAVYYMDSGVPSVKTSTLKLKASMPKPAVQKVVNPENKGVAARVNGEIISIEEIRKGYIGNPSQLASVRRVCVAEGRAKGTGIIEVTTAGGLELDILPDTGLPAGRQVYRNSNAVLHAQDTI